MKLSVKGLSISLAVLWGAALFFTGVFYVYNGVYGEAFLEVCASIYPGFQVQQSFGSVLVGTGYALLDGAVCGAVLAWVYNRCRTD